MYFADLSPYAYDRRPERSDVLNIGWLSRGFGFDTGEVPPEFVETLRRLLTRPVNLCRGKHHCDLCAQPPPVDRNGILWFEPLPGTSGNGEVRVTREAITYVAPALVLHYIQEHRYRPPAVFIAAVLATARAQSQ